MQKIHKRFLLVVVIMFQIIAARAQLNINLVGQLTYPGNFLSDIWGYVDTTGKEYALVGIDNGTSVVDISTPASPVEIFFSPGAGTIWRDLKVWNKHIYITNEANNGLKIIDISNLPGAITTGDVYQYTGSTYPFNTAHNLYIDENGYAYIIGADNGNGGAIILDLNPDPKNPVEVGRYDGFYLHDGMVRGDTLWAGAIVDGFFVVVDVSNKAAPVTMQTQSTPSFFTHNCWISDDGHTLFTTDEVSNGFIGAYDVSDLSNISELDRIQSSPGQLVIPHNAHFMNNYVITSYYTDGVTIHDVSNPSNMIEVGNYDTSPVFSGSGIKGSWGVYPWLPSGLIIASDIENGLYILGPTYVSAAYLEGNITDSLTTASLDGVQVDIVSTTASTNSNILGNYKTGLATAGTYDVSFYKSGYKIKTITGVTLTASSITNLNVELIPTVSFSLSGQVIEASTGNPIANAKVKITNLLFSTTVQTNAGGNFTMPNLYEDFYEIYIGKWGYNQLCLSNEFLNSSSNPYIYQLSDGYYDDFTFDLGWVTTGTAFSGDWEKGIPVGTSNGGDLANPGEDSQTDCVDEAFVTGNGGASINDVDVGETILTSPIFDLSLYLDPYIHFDRWFYNDGTITSTPNDSLVVELTNGSSVAKIDFSTITDTNMSKWAAQSVRVSNFIVPTSTMQLIVRVMDIGSDHIVEGGFDKFYIDELSSIFINVNEKKDIVIYPNPTLSNFTIESLNKPFNLTIYNSLGQAIYIEKDVIETSKIVDLSEYSKGLFFVRIESEGEVFIKKIIKE